LTAQKSKNDAAKTLTWPEEVGAKIGKSTRLRGISANFGLSRSKREFYFWQFINILTLVLTWP